LKLFDDYVPDKEHIVLRPLIAFSDEEISSELEKYKSFFLIILLSLNLYTPIIICNMKKDEWAFEQQKDNNSYINNIIYSTCF
jgi:hypothetical protein